MTHIIDEKNQQAIHQHGCPNCGSTVKFDPATGKLFCEHCNSTVEFDKTAGGYERDFAEMAQFSPWDDTHVAHYRCNNCGASTVLSRTELATICPFCGSPVVVDETKTGLVRPDTIVPFELTKEQAAQQLQRWQRKRLFAPKKFKTKTYAQSIRGVYLPAWTFDAQTQSSYNGTLGVRKTRTVRKDGKTYTEHYTEWFHVSGTIHNAFDDIFVRGSQTVDEKYFNQLAVVDKRKFLVYSNEFLQGYIADNYSVEPMDAYAFARSVMDRQIRLSIVAKHGADIEGQLNVHVQENSRSFKYMMMPVYVATTNYHNKTYSQYVSGVFSDNNRSKAVVCGKAPLSPWKVGLAVLAGLVVVGLFVWLAIYAANKDPNSFAHLLDSANALCLPKGTH